MYKAINVVAVPIIIAIGVAASGSLQVMRGQTGNSPDDARTCPVMPGSCRADVYGMVPPVTAAAFITTPPPPHNIHGGFSIRARG